MADWTELPIDILGLLVRRFELVEDYHRFRAVCKSWRSLTPIEEKPKFSLQFPSIMFFEENQEKKQGNQQNHRWKFYSQLTSQVHEIKLPEAARKRCMGVYPGWILTVNQDNFQIDLLNPFTRRKFNLPSMLHFEDQYEYNEEYGPKDYVHMFVEKVVASTSPGEEDDCILLAIYGEFKRLAFARLGDSVWTNINVSTKVFDNAVYYKGKFYAVDRHGVTFVCDLDHKDGPTTTIAAAALSDSRLSELDQKYIVESCGDLYLISRYRGGYLFDDDYSEQDKLMRDYFTIGFYVFRLVRDDNCMYPYRLEYVSDLGDRAFFIGHNASTSISSSECVRAICIYFCDDNFELYYEQVGGGGHDTGVFDMKTWMIEWHYVSQFQFRSPLNPPFWYK